MPKILNSYHDAKLVIAGKGGMIDELRAEAHNLGIDNKVYFTGYLDSKAVQKCISVQMLQYFQAHMNLLEL